MNTHRPSRLSEIREIVENAKRSGMIRGPRDAADIKKDGQPVAVELGLRSQWMDVDPAKATHWLHNNFNNRHCDEHTVKAYAREMLNGTWVATHQGVAFNDKDELIDGQHRLRAIVLSGKTVRMMVTFGLPSKIEGREMTTMDAVDRGRPRSVADQLKIQHGIKEGSIIAMTTRSIAALCSSERTWRMSVEQTLQIYRLFQAAIDWVVLHRSRELGLRQAGVCAGFAFALMTEESIQEGKVSVMMERMLANKDLKKGSPMKLLRAFLVSDEAKLLTRGTDRGLAELVLQAIYLELKGRPVDRLEVAPDGASFFRGAQKERVEKIASLFAIPS